MDHVAVDDDGALRVVVSARDPGVHNWLDTSGRHQGSIVFRNYRATRQPVPRTEKVRFEDLAQHLPATTRKASSDERQASLRRRHAGVLKLHGE